MTEEVFGFGAKEECLMAVGIPCKECIWEEACKNQPEPEVEKYMIGLCMGCGIDFAFDIREDNDPIFTESCPGCGCEVEWNIYEA